MKRPHITISIDTENSAFETDLNNEVSRILKRIADDLDNGKDLSSYWPLMDINGNKIGELKTE